MSIQPAPTGHRNGRPLIKPYTWRGDLGDAETRAKLEELRAQLDQEWRGNQRSRDDGEAAPASALATSAAARDAALTPPKLVVLRPVPDPDVPGGRVFEQPAPAALPAPGPAEPEPLAEPERCKTCGYLTARCCCPGGPRDLAAAPAPARNQERCRKCGYLKARCSCGGPR